ncbi:MAG: DUF6537 domain-containing protein, partial [Pseudomonadota bacterium]|nr:DUF6537 domain-containing protein [Pseudomonadota bacterium]
TGVVTIGALLGMAAHLEGKGAGVIDMSGLAQKGGAVAVHLRISDDPKQIKAIRASAAGADVVLGCDLVVTASDKILGVIREGVTTVLANSHEMMTGDFTRQPDLDLPVEQMRLALEARAGAGAAHFVDASRAAAALTGDSIAANMFLLGHAYQLGQVPVSSQAIIAAIELNKVAVQRNIDAFQWGRLAAHDPEAVAAAIEASDRPEAEERISTSLEEVITRRVEFLTAYQNRSWAERYSRRVETIRALEAERAPGETALADAVARGLFKLMAYKDEYEVARLFTEGSFARQIAKQFAGGYRIAFHLAPPILGGTDPATGRPAKRRFGQWMLPVFRVLARAKWLRGTKFDPFGYNAERRMERQLIADYEADLDVIAALLTPRNHARAVELARLPEAIRGFGPVKKASVTAARTRRTTLLDDLKSAGGSRKRAA